jgi:hypothetical protein
MNGGLNRLHLHTGTLSVTSDSNKVPSRGPGCRDTWLAYGRARHGILEQGWCVDNEQPGGERRVGEMVFRCGTEPAERAATGQPAGHGIEQPQLRQHVAVHGRGRLSGLLVSPGVAASRMAL